MRLAHYNAISCFLSIPGTLIGDGAKDGTFLCWFQGISLNWFPLSSAFWVVVIALQLQVLINGQPLSQNYNRYHIICWGVPFLVSILPLTTNTYGKGDNAAICFVSNRKDSPYWGQEFWIIASFFIWLWLSLLTVLYLVIRAGLVIHRHANDPRWIQMRKKLLPIFASYPILLFVCWCFSSYIGVYDIITGKGDQDSGVVLYYLANVMPALFGFLSAMVLLITSEDVRRHWWVFLSSGNTIAPSLNASMESRPTDGITMAEIQEQDPDYSNTAYYDEETQTVRGTMAYRGTNATQVEEARRSSFFARFGGDSMFGSFFQDNQEGRSGRGTTTRVSEAIRNTMHKEKTPP